MSLVPDSHTTISVTFLSLYQDELLYKYIHIYKINIKNLHWSRSSNLFCRTEVIGIYLYFCITSAAKRSQAVLSALGNEAMSGQVNTWILEHRKKIHLSKDAVIRAALTEDGDSLLWVGAGRHWLHNIQCGNACCIEGTKGRGETRSPPDTPQ